MVDGDPWIRGVDGCAAGGVRGCGGGDEFGAGGAAGGPIPNKDRRGNAAFLDGHADYVPRSMAHDEKHVIPQR